MEEVKKNSTKDAIPFFLRVSAILILVTGTIGSLFYLFAAIFQLSGQDYLYNIEYKGFSGVSFYMVLSMQIMLNIGLVLSSVLILNFKKSGFYIFTATFVVMSLMSFFLQGDKNIAIPLIGLVLIIILFLYRNKMN
jgi:hypothetical protein